MCSVCIQYGYPAKHAINEVYTLLNTAECVLFGCSLRVALSHEMWLIFELGSS